MCFKQFPWKPKLMYTLKWFMFTYFGSSSAFFLCGKCSRRHLPVLFVLHFLIKEMWRCEGTCGFLQKQTRHTSQLVQEDKKPVLFVMWNTCTMYIERHIGSVHERKKSVNRSYQRKTTLCQTLILNNICLYIYKKWYNGLFSSAAYTQRLITTAAYKLAAYKHRLIS